LGFWGIFYSGTSGRFGEQLADFGAVCFAELEPESVEGANLNPVAAQLFTYSGDERIHATDLDRLMRSRRDCADLLSAEAALRD
jgi:hypothetical protein